MGYILFGHSQYDLKVMTPAKHRKYTVFQEISRQKNRCSGPSVKAVDVT